MLWEYFWQLKSSWDHVQMVDLTGLLSFRLWPLGRVLDKRQCWQNRLYISSRKGGGWSLVYLQIFPCRLIFVETHLCEKSASKLAYGFEAYTWNATWLWQLWARQKASSHIMFCLIPTAICCPHLQARFVIHSFDGRSEGLGLPTWLMHMHEASSKAPITMNEQSSPFSLCYQKADPALSWSLQALTETAVC